MAGLVADGGNQQVVLEWGVPDTGGIPLSGYNVYRATAEHGPYSLIGTNSSDAGFIDTAVFNGTGYHYKVAAKNAVGEGLVSMQAQGMTWDVPGGISVLTIAAGFGQITLSWEVPATGGTPITGYNIYRSDSEGGEYSLIGQTVTATWFVDIEVADWTIYYYKVAANNAVGEAEWSPVVDAVHWGMSGVLLLAILALIVGVVLVSVIGIYRAKWKKGAGGRQKGAATSLSPSRKKKVATGSYEALPSKKNLTVQREVGEDPGASEERQKELEQTESELMIVKPRFNCLVHKGVIAGTIYTCPGCQSLYCHKCAATLKKQGERCWSCGKDIEV